MRELIGDTVRALKTDGRATALIANAIKDDILIVEGDSIARLVQDHLEGAGSRTITVVLNTFPLDDELALPFD